MKLILSDGTQVFLNADSKFKVPQNFNAKKREVYLTGEAYFKVVKNPDKPFMVHSQGTVTRDLGTSFDIRAYPDNENVTVVVKEGKVNFKAEDSRQKDVITAKQMAGYNMQDHKITRKKIDDLGLYLGWTRNEINFKDASMRNVANRLERRYNINIVFKDLDIKSMKLTASLKNSTTQHVLNLIAKALDIKYRIKNDTVIFSDK
jgi:ferric-dicitrate binding protein FerR (iron transport regulator)